MAIPIYIGTEPMQWLPTEVLKYSIRKRTKSDVVFHNLEGIELNLNTKMYTGFSFYRYCIPELCGYQGRAIYLDADMVVLRDISELYNLEMGDKPVLARPNKKGENWFTSCMLMDCARLKHWKTKEWVALINAGLASYGGTMSGAKNGMNHNDFGPLPEEWNHLDQFDEKTKLIHYTNVPTQPWKRAGHAHAFVFLKELKNALEEEVISHSDLIREIEAAHIFPEILENIEALGA